MSDDIRRQQRFHNYEKAFLLLEHALTIATPSEVECVGCAEQSEAHLSRLMRFVPQHILRTNTHEFYQ